MTVPTLKIQPLPAPSNAGKPLSLTDELWVSHLYSWKSLILPVVLLMSAWFVFPYDVWVSLHCYQYADGHPRWLQNIFDNVEPFGHGVGVVVVALLIFLLEKKQRPTGWTVLSGGLGAGLVANIGKLCVSRVRPRNTLFLNMDSQSTITGWMPLLNGNSGQQSFPSAHAATAFAMAIILSSLYPRARLLFCVLAVLVLGHRLHYGAHYLSDVLVGAAIGLLFGMLCLRLGIRWRFLVIEKPKP